MGNCVSDVSPSGLAEVDTADKQKIERVKSNSRRQGFSAEAISDERMSTWKRPVHPKDEETSKLIESLLKGNTQLQVMLGSVLRSPDALKHLIEAMFLKSIKSGEVVINQGDAGDMFYVVESGTFDVYVQRGDKPAAKVVECGPGSSFGELALMWNSPRAATVKATSDAKCWCLDRESFRMMIVTAEASKQREVEQFLSKVPILQDFNRYEISHLADVMAEELKAPGESIVKQGDHGTNFYLLVSGDATAFMDGEAGRLAVKHYQAAGDYFGEIALIRDEPRNASVVAGEKGCKVLTIDKDGFDRVLGPITDRLKSQEYLSYSQIQNP